MRSLSDFRHNADTEHRHRKTDRTSSKLTVGVLVLWVVAVIPDEPPNERPPKGDFSLKSRETANPKGLED